MASSFWLPTTSAMEQLRRR
ncbi:hypothetical protein M8C21_016024 [Ambrosia artemisiifolia]|uniref:Uncharacterized protein n=1 Tax=Ambrosia artemisiifolia TaxID=4212 RepID=A0AAD5CQJ8_AMBAR|nr:hypothetical protein M8C21_016024 [Ambrosia artemisiifolia]